DSEGCAARRLLGFRKVRVLDRKEYFFGRVPGDSKVPRKSLSLAWGAPQGVPGCRTHDGRGGTKCRTPCVLAMSAQEETGRRIRHSDGRRARAWTSRVRRGQQSGRSQQ